MLKAIASFETRYHLKGALFWILFAIFFLLTFGAVTSDAVQIGGSLGNVNRNAPFVIMQFMLIMSLFGVLTTTAFVANAVHRDFELNTDALFFSSPIRKWEYLAGRFTGSFAVATLVYFGVVTAIMIGSLMPWLEKDRIGPFTLQPYLYSFFVLVVPNLFLVGAIFFCVAALTRSMMATYSGVVGFFVAYGISRAFLGNLKNEKIATLIDPFGLSPFALSTRYWTVFERNHNVLPLEGVFLWNRILWIAIGVIVLAVTFWKFDFTASLTARRKKKTTAEDDAPLPRIALELPAVTQRFGGSASLQQYLHTTRLEAGTILRGVPFLIILVLGVLNTIGNAVGADRLFDTPVYPVTHLMLQTIDGGFILFTILILAFYSGDIVFRERSLRLNEVHDAMPAPTWTIWAAKLTALVLVTSITLVVAALTTIAFQTFKGYHHYELALYAKGLLGDAGVALLLIAAFAFFVQVVTNNKYVGFLLIALYIVSINVLPALHLEHRLYRILTTPDAPYSDMNGYGHYVWRLVTVETYWVLFAIALVVIAHLFWVRGTDAALRQRLRIARQRFGKPALATLATALALFGLTGCYIFYNTNVLNQYRTTDQREKQRAAFEKKYKRYERLPQPHITDVQADVDIFPAARAVEIRGTYTLVNETSAPVPEIHVVANPELTSSRVNIPGARLKMSDAANGYSIYTLAQPLPPGATLPVTFTTSWRASGFPNSNDNTNVVENGTFINNVQYFPHIGYQQFGELDDRNKRKKYGLPPVQRLPKINDRAAWGTNEISSESDWLNLDTTVSTSSDQIAVAPGYLQKEWTAGGRRYFRYKTTSPILGFWSYLSARYEVKRDRWHDVNIEIYYDKDHPYNVDRMIYAAKKSLDYFTTNFSPYQHRQVRILEFPRYARFAQSFPNTIPFSESIGFIADLRKKDDIDYVFYVTAHEIAHQWWGHQVCGAAVQGTTMITETLAQYSALMVQEKEYGRDQMRKFLRHELNRYLAGRGGELVAEMPLMLVENQAYIHYGKGSVVMYALRDQIGEENVNRALREFIARHAFRGAPYPRTDELVALFRSVTPPEKQQVITDLFETITLYDNRTTQAAVQPLPGGKYRVTFTVNAKKLRSTGGGAEQAVPLDDWIEVGVLGGKKDDKVLFSEKRHVTAPVMTIDVVVNQKPSRAGIDPFHKLIDRNPDDNTKQL